MSLLSPYHTQTRSPTLPLKILNFLRDSAIALREKGLGPDLVSHLSFSDLSIRLGPIYHSEQGLR